jgi:CheY-like chemotaxis protein
MGIESIVYFSYRHWLRWAFDGHGLTLDFESTMSKELDDAILSLLKLAEIPCENRRYSAAQINQAVEVLRQRLAGVVSPATLSSGESSTASGISPRRGRTSDLKNQKILIAGEIGIIAFQLKQALSRLGAEVTISKDVGEAVTEYQKQAHSLVLIDLYMPTEREGLIVLRDIRKIAASMERQPDILVLSIPSKDKRLQEACKSSGADVYLEKNEGWHKRVVDFCLGQLPEDIKK